MFLTSIFLSFNKDLFPFSCISCISWFTLAASGTNEIGR